MIKSWTLEYFKSVYEKTTLQLAPLTIFAGANSSGKSTIIQSLLLATQTLQNPVHARPVILNGHIIRMGTYDDVVSNNHESQDIFIGFELKPINGIISRLFYSDPDDGLAEVHCSFSFSARCENDEEKDVLQLQPRLEHSYVKIKTSINKNEIEEEISIKRSKNKASEKMKMLKLLDHKIGISEKNSMNYEIIKPSKTRNIRGYRSVPASGKPVGASFVHFLPQKVSMVYDTVDELLKLIEHIIHSDYRYRYIDLELAQKALKNEAFRSILIDMFEEIVKSTQNEKPSRISRINRYFEELKRDFSIPNVNDFTSALSSSLKSILVQKFQERIDEIKEVAKTIIPAENAVAFAPLPDLVELAVDYMREFFSQSVKYLGPLRDEPKPVYPLSGTTDSRDVGFRGEHTAAVLDVHKNSIVEYIPSDQFLLNVSNPEKKEDTLQNAVLDWLKYMGVVNDFKTTDKGKLGHELKVTTTGAESMHDLTHVGVGVSQVLPILVLSLLAKKGSTLIFEQPELHLHPKVQSRLADFFVSMTMLNKQCIVETHSEYLINRLRYRAVISDGNEISENVNMYFVEKDKGHSDYRLLKMNEFGVIKNWPKGFFDEIEDNAAAILSATLEKRKKARGNVSYD